MTRPARRRRCLRAVVIKMLHGRGRLQQWRWTVIVLAVGGMVSTGCLPLEFAYLHSTSFVAPIMVASTPAPTSGALVAVKVEDRRAGVAGYEVGAKYSSYEGSTIDLKNKVRLADLVGQDAVAMLRKQGYRAQIAGEIPEDSADILLTIRIDTFNVVLILDLDVRLDGLLFMEAVQRRESRRWTDAVGARFEVASSLYPSDAEFERCFERLYVTLRDKMRERFTLGLPA